MKYRIWTVACLFSIALVLHAQSEPIVSNSKKEISRIATDEDESIYQYIISTLAQKKALQEHPEESYQEVALDRIAAANVDQKIKRDWSVLLRATGDPLIQKFAIIASNEGLIEVPKRLVEAGYSLDGFSIEKPKVVQEWQAIVVDIAKNRKNLLKDQRELFNHVFLSIYHNYGFLPKNHVIVESKEGFKVLSENEFLAFNALLEGISALQENTDIKNYFPTHIMYGSSEAKKKVAFLLDHASTQVFNNFVQRAYYYGIKSAHTKQEVDEIVSIAVAEIFLIFPPKQFSNLLLQQGLEWIHSVYDKPGHIDENIDVSHWLQRHEETSHAL